MVKLLALLVSLTGMVVAYFELQPDAIKKQGLDGEIRYDVRVLRDVWGVPHIFGKSDADVAFGLAYAHAEDDFKTIQQTFLAARGRLAEVLGRKYAPVDYMVALLRVWDFVEAGYDTALSAKMRAVLEGYAAGLNHYAALHRRETLPGLFPLTGKDVIASFLLKLPFFFGLHETIKRLHEGPPPKPRPAKEVAQRQAPELDWTPAFGSNTFAVAPTRQAQGKTLLAINSHQPWEGPFTWYEVHLRSEEGWDMVGGVFPGTPVVFHGHNRHLGWAHTVNKPDLVDVYELEIHPDNPNLYRFDGRWRKLEVRKVPIRVKIFGPIKWTKKVEVLWSVYGPTIRRPYGTYAIRYAGMGDVRAVEQWYRMNKARNFQEWLAALRMQAIPMFNIGYADAEGNIAYFYNATVPVRDETYDWSGTLPGNTSETLWTRYLPLERLPQVVNPSSGFIQNCNSTPFRTTVGPDNPRLEDFSHTMGIGLGLTNRARRALELFGADSSITEEEFYQYKFDVTYSKDSQVARYVQQILNTPPPDSPLAREALRVLAAWDLRSNPENRSAALAILTLKTCHELREQNGGEEPDMMAVLVQTARKLQERFGRIDVEWQQVNRLIRGKVDLGLGGSPDVLHAVYGEEMEDGRLRGFVGDCFMMLVSWDRDGRVSSRSIHQYGSATSREDSPHYADQAPLFVQNRLKPVWMDEAAIRQHLEREYRPGEEVR